MGDEVQPLGEHEQILISIKNKWEILARKTH
jgi:hypothetical protein